MFVIFLDHVAIGAADGCLRVWNLSETSKIDITTVMLYTRMKVMSVSLLKCFYVCIILLSVFIKLFSFSFIILIPLFLLIKSMCLRQSMEIFHSHTHKKRTDSDRKVYNFFLCCQKK